MPERDPRGVRRGRAAAALPGVVLHPPPPPRPAPQPIRESAPLTGPLEATNQAYALAEITGLVQVQSCRRQYGASHICAMPTNLYGPEGNFDPQSSHVMPALVRRFHEAKRDGLDEVVLRGGGTPRREFLHVDDLGEACTTLLRHHGGSAPVNVGCGQDLTVRELAYLVAEVVGFEGRIGFGPSKPDGTPRKVLDVSRTTALDWRPRTPLRDGIAATYAARSAAAGATAGAVGRADVRAATVSP